MTDHSDNPAYDGPRIGVFGGSFDPIHIGHLIIADNLYHGLQLDELLFLPAGDPPHKHDQQVTSADTRVELVAAAIAGIPEFELCRVDVDRPGYSYTVDTLRILRSQRPEAAEWYFLMGEDSLRDFPTWRQPAEIATLARLGVARRPEVDVDIAGLVAAIPSLAGRIALVDVPLIGISSSDIRERVRSGQPYRFLVPAPVASLIREKRLYQNDSKPASPTAKQRRRGVDSPSMRPVH
ncbi:MAG: nicotinic acid mononucleotide adenylyltransferase [Chloroflexi bacterium]|nr:MAG: nicotinic acid mononucleotide adenylyltransferase [Chloroflexota bacterium]